MGTPPGADERRMQAILRQRGVGPDAVPPASPRPRDWLDDILNSPPAEPEEPSEPAPAEPPAAAEPAKPKTAKTRKPDGKKRKNSERPKPGKARTAWDTRPPSPRQSLLDAWDQVPYRLKWLINHAAATYAGWRLGWVGWSTDTAAWFAAGHWTSASAWALYGIGAAVWALYAGTRTGWRWPVSWAFSIPVSSVVVGALLYGTGYQP